MPHQVFNRTSQLMGLFFLILLNGINLQNNPLSGGLKIPAKRYFGKLSLGFS